MRLVCTKHDDGPPAPVCEQANCVQSVYCRRQQQVQQDQRWATCLVKHDDFACRACLRDDAVATIGFHQRAKGRAHSMVTRGDEYPAYPVFWLLETLLVHGVLISYDAMVRRTQYNTDTCAARGRNDVASDETNDV